MLGARGWLLVSMLSASAFAADARPAQIEKKSQAVLLNTRTHKFHSLTCEWARKCTRNCVQVSRDEALKRSAAPCKVCGGR